MIQGKGSPDETLTDRDICDVIDAATNELPLDGARVLLIIPDSTRTCPIGWMLKQINAAWRDKVARLDVLIALGTHSPMEPNEIYEFCNIDQTEHERTFSKTDFFNHEWKNPGSLKLLGRISGDKMAQLSQGRMREEIDVTINHRILDYNQLVVVGPTFPHETVGMSGGNKYFFPGIAGSEIIDAFHWLGALITNREVIGRHYTPVRAVIDYCASMIRVPRHCFSLVVRDKDLYGLYFGTPEEAYDRAATLSAEVNVREVSSSFHTVVSVCPTMYPDLWTAGKCMYKLEPVVAPGGTLIIYGPHIKEVSKSHGDLIEEVGYHVLPYFTYRFEEFRHRYPLKILAHSTNVKGSGLYANGVETPDINVVLATDIPPEVCARINLGYLNPNSIHPDDYRRREAEGILVVKKAGEVLYKLAASGSPLSPRR
jgi:lactate racemase